MGLLNLGLVCSILCLGPGAKPLSFDDAYKLLSAPYRSVADAEALTGYFGADVTRGAPGRSEDLRYLFGISTPSADPVKVVADDGTWNLDLPKVSGTNLHAAATTLTEGVGFHWHYEVGAAHFGGGDLEALTYPSEGKVHEGVPKGQLIPQDDFKSKIFAGTTRHWWIYVPAQYDATKPACLFVVQDAQWQRNYWTTVMDNMIAQKDLPVTIGVFLTPGYREKEWDNRSVEYDTVSDAYVRMLSEEILPDVMKRYSIRPDGAAHLIAGASSGGICSFNAAWQRPELFQKVVSWIGSFTNLQGGPTGVAGGNTYPAIIRERAGWDRKGAPKPIRVFLQDGSNDLDNRAGNWPLANQEMAKALAYGGYDYQFVFGHGAHSDKLGQVKLPDTLRWMFRDFGK